MRREKFDVGQGLDAIDMAAVWPTLVQLAPFSMPELPSIREDQLFRATPAAPDVPAAVGVMIAASYGALILALAVATVRSSYSIFMIVIAALFVVAFFTVPRIFFHVERESLVRSPFDDFMQYGMDTFTGHNSGKGALVQMLIIPVVLTLAVVAIGVEIAIVG